MKKIGFIGMGNMASAIAGGLIKSKSVEARDVYGYDVDKNKLQAMNEAYGIQIKDIKSEIDLVKAVDIVILAIKPNIVEKIILTIKEALDNKAVISIVAGYSYEAFETLLLPSTRHLTIMPNTPALVMEGMTLFEAENSLTKEEFSYAKSLFSNIGVVQVLPSSQMKAGGALSGCGPAFVYMMIEALADGAVMQGLPREVAYTLASQTVLGSGKMQKITKQHPGSLKDSVCSPGGITIKGVKALEDAGFRAAIMEAIKKTSI